MKYSERKISQCILPLSKFIFSVSLSNAEMKPRMKTKVPKFVQTLHCRNRKM